MYHSHTLDEWLAMVCLAVSGYAALSSPYFLLVDADLADFDPRPALARTRSPLWQGAVHAGHDLNRAIAACERVAKAAVKDAARSVAALLALLLPAAGGTR
jgi:hypothetical protein